MGERRAGLRRVGFRRVGEEADSAGGGGNDWAGQQEAWAAGVLGLTVGEYSTDHETFSYPGNTAASAVFTPRWDVIRPGGPKHRLSGGTVWRGGVMTVEETTGAWNDDGLIWAGPGLFMDSATEKGAVIFRCQMYLPPAASVFNFTAVGLADAFPTTKFVGLCRDESLNPTFCTFQITGQAPIVTTFTLASLASVGGRNVALLQSGSTWTAYVDRVSYATFTTTGLFGDLKPMIYCNKGIFVVDDVLSIFGGAFSP